MREMPKRLKRELDRIQLSCWSSFCEHTTSYNEYEKHILGDNNCLERVACIQCKEKPGKAAATRSASHDVGVRLPVFREHRHDDDSFVRPRPQFAGDVPMPEFLDDNDDSWDNENINFNGGRDGGRARLIDNSFSDDDF